MKRIFALSITWALLFFGCTIADEDRCPDGYEYRSDEKICYFIEDAGTEDDGGGGEPGEGFWKACENDDDCADTDASYCALIPGEEGNCTYRDCDTLADGCPSG